jgi:dihydroorotase-like cyclic amidohydrolase
LLLAKALENMTRFLGAGDVRRFIATVTTNPRRWLGLIPETITMGEDASFVRWQWDAAKGRLHIQETVRAGKTRFFAGKNG